MKISSLYNISNSNQLIQARSFKQYQLKNEDNFVRTNSIDIKLKNKYPGNVLSNLSSTNFSFDGIQIKSMEGFLQSLKTKNEKEQKKICQLSGIEAKKISKGLLRQKGDTLLFWKEKTFRQDSPEFKDLIKKVNQIRKNSSEQDEFYFDGYKIKSIEGLILALRTPNEMEKQRLCSLNTEEAKKESINIPKILDERILYWKGKPINRNSKNYKNLLKRVYKERYIQDKSFRDALLYTKGCQLTHKIGKTNPNETILTSSEFIEILNFLRQNHFYLDIKAKIKELLINNKNSYCI